ncbi:hypothetical protein GO988_15425 [Hymenobacter sp. HMF4947]|uniref:Uncharacterized protein n=1 Tax=Hymenobacter ginkgonis TaxID=2682976 RepID=A0A7K1THA1_9BACT|nr:hypothetical protein [Hymenobacter ginkgonis]MVN77723.1 hypothetical protein [Hymenobacter ginkgonis]
MTAADLPTVGYLDHWFRALLARVEAPAAAAAAPAASDVVLYSVQALAEVLSVDPGTVRRWLKVGKPDPHDPQNAAQNIRLQAFYFNSEARIPWAAVVAYERGLRFELATLPPPTAAPPKPGTVAPVPAPPVANGEPPGLRLAS